MEESVMPGKLALCFDGTWNKKPEKGSEWKETNVLKIYNLIATGNETNQEKIYISGVGTKGTLDSAIGGATGYGLTRNIQKGYTWLASNYEEGDEIFLFGFSRGAYTARSLAGLIRKCGILHRKQVHMVDVAYDLYRQRDAGPDTEEAKYFRDAFSREVEIKFIGVWDTVGSLGLPLFVLDKLDDKTLFAFHDTELSKIVKNAYHAVAIDERRKDFDVTLWDSDKLKDGQQMEQRWFVGSHSDIGGGYEDPRLSDITLRWMQLKARDCGLIFDSIVETDPEYGFAPFHKPWNQLLYFLRYRVNRPIGKTRNGMEIIDESAISRWKDRSTNYRPPHNTSFIDMMREQVQKERQ
jgi:uncharacterized protein (DUF2235 family)